MSETLKFEATLRERAGKGAARAVRREGRIPAVIYGDNKEPVLITIAGNELQKILNRGGLLTSISEIKVGSDMHRVLARDIQFHPVKDLPEHVDFLRVTKKTKITVSVPVAFLNEETAPGIKRGGIVNCVRHTLDVTCSADSIPDAIEFDLGTLEIGDSVHMEDAQLPEDVKLSTEENFTVAAIVAPSSLAAAEDAEEGEEAVEGEEATAEAPEEEAAE